MNITRASSGRGVELFLGATHGFFAALAGVAAHWLLALCFAGASLVSVAKAILFPKSGDAVPPTYAWLELVLGIVALGALWHAWSNGLRL